MRLAPRRPVREQPRALRPAARPRRPLCPCAGGRPRQGGAKYRARLGVQGTFRGSHPSPPDCGRPLDPSAGVPPSESSVSSNRGEVRRKPEAPVPLVPSLLGQEVQAGERERDTVRGHERDAHLLGERIGRDQGLLEERVDRPPYRGIESRSTRVQRPLPSSGRRKCVGDYPITEFAHPASVAPSSWAHQPRVPIAQGRQGTVEPLAARTLPDKAIRTYASRPPVGFIQFDGPRQAVDEVFDVISAIRERRRGELHADPRPITQRNASRRLRRAASGPRVGGTRAHRA